MCSRVGLGLWASLGSPGGLRPLPSALPPGLARRLVRLLPGRLRSIIPTLGHTGGSWAKWPLKTSPLGPQKSLPQCLGSGMGLVAATSGFKCDSCRDRLAMLAPRRLGFPRWMGSRLLEAGVSLSTLVSQEEKSTTAHPVLKMGHGSAGQEVCLAPRHCLLSLTCDHPLFP